MIKILETITKTSAVYSIGNMSGKLVGFILLPIITAKFSVIEFGIIGLAEVSSQVFIILFSLGLSTSYERWYFEIQSEIERKSLLFTVLISTLILILIMILTLFLYIEEITFSLFKDINYIYLMKLIILVSAFEILNNLFFSLMRIQESAKLLVFTNLIKTSLSFLLTLIFLLYHNKGIESIYEALIIANIVYIILLSKYLIQNIHFKIETKHLIQMLHFSYPLVLSNFFLILLNVADRYMLNYITGTKDVGLYTLGYKIANTIKIFVISSIQTALVPIVLKKMNDPDRLRFYAKIMTYMTLLILYLSLIVSFFGKEIILLISDKSDYLGAFTLIPIITLSILFSTLKDISINGLTLVKKTKIIGLIVSAIALINILLNYLLIPIWSSNGAAIASLISQIVYFFIMVYFAQKHYFIPYEIFKIFKIILISVIYFILILSLNINNNLLFIFLKLIALLIYPYILYLFKIYEKIEVEKVKLIINKRLNKFNLNL